MNKFGGSWTEEKIEIIVEYARAYLKIMNRYASVYNWKLLYFDGFAGPRFIKKGKNKKLIVGAARRILAIEEPRSFDLYYFVEKDTQNAQYLKENTLSLFPDKEIHIARNDCNEKIISLSEFLSGKNGNCFKTYKP